MPIRHGATAGHWQGTNVSPTQPGTPEWEAARFVSDKRISRHARCQSLSLHSLYSTRRNYYILYSKSKL
eukprot:5856564-Amphidinium_carterae.1